ncbi:MAG TPA: DUF1573 domain-containing protein [candidate division Zixibacteria bacterium]|nr:DUF1573 domain-containing protein [candidate division Zixibacteria bacterium]
MKKWMLLTILLIIAVSPIVAQPQKANPVETANPIPVEGEAAEEITGPQPVIEVPEQKFDFGYAPEGYYMAHSFAVKNTGEGELRIQRVRTTCGCTSAPMKKMQLEPGEETEVTVVFNSARYQHKTSKSAIITSNDPVNRSVRITFSANMDETGFPLEVEPRALDVPRGEDPPKEMVFEIKNPTGKDIELEMIDYTADVFAKPEMKHEKIKAGKSSEIVLKLADEFDAAANYIKASVTLQVKGLEGDPVIFTIPVKGSGPS